MKSLQALAFAACLLSTSHGQASEQAPGEAVQLAERVKAPERELQGLRFMLANALFEDAPKGFSDCAVKTAEPALLSLFAALYAKQMSAAELRQALAFFESEQGRAAVDLQLRQERAVFDAVAGGEQVQEKAPEFPPDVKQATDAFAATKVGRFFFGDDALAQREDVRKAVSDARDAGIAACLSAPSSGDAEK